MTNGDGPLVLFFGVRTGTGAGHYLCGPGGRYVDQRTLPEPLQRLDGVWTRATPRTTEEVRDRYRGKDPEAEGRAFIHFVAGWTVVSWWDRSEDRRGGCCAVFLTPQRCTFAEMLALARAEFPREMARMEAAYSIGLAGGDLPVEGHEEAAKVFVAQFRELHADVQATVRRMLRGP